MKILLDACVWSGACPYLADRGHDVVWAGAWPDSPSDDEILARANVEERVMVTLDKDFGELFLHQGRPHHGILRLVDVPARGQGAAIAVVLNSFGPELLEGALLVLEPSRVRIRRAPK